MHKTSAIAGGKATKSRPHLSRGKRGELLLDPKRSSQEKQNGVNVSSDVGTVDACKDASS